LNAQNAVIDGEIILEIMKKVFIVHGWDFNPNMNWYPWIKKELEKKGFEVIVPKMPNTSEPKIKEWVSHLKKIVGKLSRDTCFIGHSIGCQTIMRYLEKENYKGKINKIVFVAGWFKLDNLEDEEVEVVAKPWLNTKIELNKVREKISKLTVFLSDNDPYNFLKENEIMFKKELGARVVILKDKGHFTDSDKVNKLPVVLQEFKNTI